MSARTYLLRGPAEQAVENQEQPTEKQRGVLRGTIT